MLTNTLAIMRDVVLDASGHNVAISGSNAVRLFTVSPGVRATFNNLALVDGRYQGTNGDWNGTPGEPAFGGAIYNNGGRVELRSCVLSNNAAIGGQGASGGDGRNQPGGLANGGAIYNALGTLTLTNCYMVTNMVKGGSSGYTLFGYGKSGDALGGAIYSTNGSISSFGCHFELNRAAGGGGELRWLAGSGGTSGNADGGALFSTEGTLWVEDSVFLKNSTEGGLAPYGVNAAGYGRGGAVGALSSTVVCVRSTFWINQAVGGTVTHLGAPGEGRGGAVHATGPGECYLRQCTLVSNLAKTRILVAARGGAIYADTGLLLEESTLMYNCALGGESYALDGRTALPPGPSAGGGVYTVGACDATNATFFHNVAQGGTAEFNWVPARGADAFGGGMFQEAGTSHFMNVTLASNLAVGGAPSAGGIPGVGHGGSVFYTNGVVWIYNSILANGSPTNANQALSDGGYNLSTDGSCNLTNTGSLNQVNARLDTLRENGGPTPTVALFNGSPAIDAGEPTFCLPTDQRGQARPEGTRCDMGAYEGFVYGFLWARTANSLLFDIAGEPGRQFVVESSTNLVNWSAVSTNTFSQTSFTYEISNLVTLPPQIFRVRWP